MGTTDLGDLQDYVLQQMKQNASFVSALVAAYYDRTHIDPRDVELIEETFEGPTSLRKKYYFRRRNPDEAESYAELQKDYIRLRNQHVAVQKVAYDELGHFVKRNDPAWSMLYEKVLALRLKCADYESLQDRANFLARRLDSETQWANDYFHKWEAAQNIIEEMKRSEFYEKQRYVDAHYEWMQEELKKAKRKIDALETQLSEVTDGVLSCEWCDFQVSYTDQLYQHALAHMREHKTTCEKDPANIRIKELEKVLFFYGDPRNYQSAGESKFSNIDRDNGQLAAEALWSTIDQE